MTGMYRSVGEGQLFESASSPFTQRTEPTGGKPLIRKNQVSGPGRGQALVVPEALARAGFANRCIWDWAGGRLWLLVPQVGSRGSVTRQMSSSSVGQD